MEAIDLDVDGASQLVLGRLCLRLLTITSKRDDVYIAGRKGFTAHRLTIGRIDGKPRFLATYSVFFSFFSLFRIFSARFVSFILYNSSLFSLLILFPSFATR